MPPGGERLVVRLEFLVTKACPANAYLLFQECNYRAYFSICCLSCYVALPSSQQRSLPSKDQSLVKGGANFLISAKAASDILPSRKLANPQACL